MNIEILFYGAIMQIITQRVLSDTVYSKGTAVLTYTIRYPYFTTTCSESAALSINAFYSAAAKKTEEYCHTVLASQASVQAEYAQKDNYPFFGYEFISAYTVTWNSGCMTSLYTDQYTYTGGAHGSTIRTSDTWDFSSGRQLHLDDISPLTPAALTGLQTAIEQQIAERLKESPGAYFEDYPYLLRNYFNQSQFFLRPGQIVIYYQQYEIAPYATGVPEFSFPRPYNQITTRR